MFDLKQFGSAMAQIADEKGISQEKVLETIEMALAAAYKKEYGKKGQLIRAKMDKETGKVDLFQVKLVVEESMLKPEEEEIPTEEGGEKTEKRDERTEREEEIEYDANGEKKIRFNPERHIMIEDARKIKEDAKIDDELVFPLEAIEDYGRIAAQTAKQVVIQRIREAERETIFNEFKDKEGQLVSGIVQRMEGRNIFVDIGRATGVMFPEEQIPGERYRLGQRLKFYVLSISKELRGPGIILSRSHPCLVEKLFELEVPEIVGGTVEIKSISREAGSRTKMAVTSAAEGVDPVGSCVGQRGTRVAAVIAEIGGEKIDIIEWNSDTSKFIAQSLSPAKVIVVVLNGRKKEARVEVPEDQLSLAIGRGGQNVRLAARLTGWGIDVVAHKSSVVETTAETAAKKEENEIESEIDIQENSEPKEKTLADLDGVGPKTFKLLKDAGYNTIADLKDITSEDLEKIEGIGEKTVQKILEQIK